MHPWPVSVVRVHLPQTPWDQNENKKKNEKHSILSFYCAVVVCTASCLPVLNCWGPNWKYRPGPFQNFERPFMTLPEGGWSAQLSARIMVFLFKTICQNNVNESTSVKYLSRKWRTRRNHLRNQQQERGLSSFVSRLPSHRQQNKSYSQIAVRFR